MSDRDQLYQALRNADAAGDTASAQQLASYIQSLPVEPEMHTFQTQHSGKAVSFQAPANASDADIRAAAVRATGSQAYGRSAIQRGQEVTPQAGDTRPTSFVQGLEEGFMNVANHAAGWTERGLDAVGNAIGLGDVGHAINSIGPSLGMAGSVAEAEAQQQQDFGSQPTQGSGMGRFAGEAVATLPLASLPGGAFTQGAAGGALLSNADSAGGVARDAAIGGIGGVVGGAALRGAARVVAPVVNPLVQRLASEGVRLLPGQIAAAPTDGVVSAGARTVKRVEDVVRGIPVAGAGVDAAARRGVADLNLAATRRALRPIGETLPAGIAPGHDAIRYSGDQLSNAYNAVLPSLNGQADNAFARRLRAIVQRADLPPGYEQQTQSVINEALKAFRPHNPPTGVDTPITFDQIGQLPPTQWIFNGRRLRDASERLGDLASGFRADNDPYKRILGDVAQQTRDQLHALARRENPASAARLRDIDRGYASLVRVERAAAGTTDGTFTPRQYDAAVRGSDRSARRRGSARGRALDQDLSSAASQVMADTAAQGGSRDVNPLLALGVLGTSALGGSLPAIGGLAGIAAGSAAYSAPAQTAIRALMTRTPGLTAQNAARLLEYGARVAPISSAAAVGSLSQQPPQ